MWELILNWATRKQRNRHLIKSLNLDKFTVSTSNCDELRSMIEQKARGEYHTTMKNNTNANGHGKVRVETFKGGNAVEYYEVLELESRSGAYSMVMPDRNTLRRVKYYNVKLGNTAFMRVPHIPNERTLYREELEEC